MAHPQRAHSRQLAASSPRRRLFTLGGLHLRSSFLYRLCLCSPCLLALACGESDGEDASEAASPASMTVAPATAAISPSAASSNTAASNTAAANSASDTAASSTPPASSSPAGSAEPPSGPRESEEAEAPAAQSAVFAACTYSEGSYGRNCDSVFVTMKQTSPARCVQLTFDNCGDYDRQGLGASVPMGWRLESGAVSSNPANCELGEFDPSSTIAQRAAGTVTWNETTRLPSDIVLDLTLDTAVSGSAAMLIGVATTAPLATPVCDR